MTRKEIADLDGLWALTVKEKAKYRCEHCGRYDSRMEAAHVVGRRHRATRWGAFVDSSGSFFLPVLQIPNELYDLCGHCLCHTCHQEYDEHGPLEPAIVERTVGLERKESIQIFAKRKIAKWQVFGEIEALIKKERAVNDDSPYAND